MENTVVIAIAAESDMMVECVILVVWNLEKNKIGMRENLTTAGKHQRLSIIGIGSICVQTKKNIIPFHIINRLI